MRRFLDHVSSEYVNFPETPPLQKLDGPVAPEVAVVRPLCLRSPPGLGETVGERGSRPLVRLQDGADIARVAGAKLLLAPVVLFGAVAPRSEPSHVQGRIPVGA